MLAATMLRSGVRRQCSALSPDTLDDDWDQEICWLPGYSHGKCWNSDTELGWLSWPVEADAERTITIYHYPEYHWTSCYCGHKKFSTPTYDVD